MDIGFSHPTQMTEEQAFELLGQWFQQKGELTKLRASEMLCRKELAAHFFPMPNEGTNKVPIPANHELVLSHSIIREIDEPLLNALGRELYEQGVPMDLLIVYKPSLKLAEYRKLNDAQRALFDQIITSKEGSPTLEIKPASAHSMPVESAPLQVAQVAQVADEQVATPVDGPISIDNYEEGRKGDYYEDGDGDWWYCTRKGKWHNIPANELAAHFAEHGKVTK